MKLRQKVEMGIAPAASPGVEERRVSQEIYEPLLAGGWERPPIIGVHASSAEDDSSRSKKGCCCYCPQFLHRCICTWA